MICLHICCGPCSLYPIKILQEQGHSISGFFYNPNIQPAMEFYRRYESAKKIAEMYKIPLYTGDRYDPIAWLKHVHEHKIAHTKDRCTYCYRLRLEACAEFAKENNFSGFSTSLLYSRFQSHDLLISLGTELSKKYDIDFYYEDWRKYWNEGINLSKELELYRQNYCACIFSEMERFTKKINSIY